MERAEQRHQGAASPIDDDVDCLMFKKLVPGDGADFPAHDRDLSSGDKMAPLNARPTARKSPQGRRRKSPCFSLSVGYSPSGGGGGGGGRHRPTEAKRSLAASRSADSSKQQQQLGCSTSKIKQLADSESMGGATSTSEVNSNDDAGSIASRLSQIVVEQEDKLRASRDSLDFDFANGGGCDCDGGEGDEAADDERRDGCADGHQLGADRPRLHSLGGRRRPPVGSREANLKPVKSSGDIIASSGSRSAAATRRHDSSSSVFEHNFGLDQGDARRHLPQIQVQPYETTTAAGARERSSSMVGAPPRLQQRHEWSACGPNLQPERGDLRALETRRLNGRCEQRGRSNTAGSAAAATSESMLNICRSAWTLSDFDQTFNKRAPAEPQEPADQREPDSGLGGQLEAQAAGARRISGAASGLENSLLVRASRKALSLSQQQSAGSPPPDPQQQQQHLRASGRASGPKHSLQGPQQLVAAAAGNGLAEPAESRATRRPSASQSTNSFASSRDSFRSSKIGNIFRLANRWPAEPRKAPPGAAPDWAEPDEAAPARQRACCCSNTAALKRFLPALAWLPAYRRDYLAGDLTAGFVVAAINISTSLSAAVVAETGLGVAFRASIINTLVYSLLCSSRHTSFGSWSIMSQMLVISVRRALSDEFILSRINLGPAASWEPEEYEMWHMNIIIMFTFLIGLVQLVSGLLNLGSIMASFIPEALCSSMIAATAFTMLVGQLANMCGTSNKILWAIEKNTTELWADLKNPPIDITDLFAGLFRWIKQIALLIKHYEQINPVCVCISLGSVLFLFLCQYVGQPQLKRLLKLKQVILPSELILVVLVIALSDALDLSNVYKVATCGAIQINFDWPSLPNLRLFRELWFDSLATALISFTMVYIMARTYSNKFNYEIDCNQELIACGAGNLIGGLFDALPATSAFTRTNSQVEAGGQTQLASLINCLVLIVFAHFLGQYVAALPVCVASATLFYGFVRMTGRFREGIIYWRICKVDFAIWLVTCASILTLDILNGFLYGLVFSILTMLYRAQNRRAYLLGSIAGATDVYVPLAKYPAARELAGIKIFQFCGPIHYVCADLFEKLLRQKTRVDVKQILSGASAAAADRTSVGKLPAAEAPAAGRSLPTHIILDFSMISFIDSAGIHALKKIINDYDRVNVTVLLASLASHVAKVVKSEPTLWEVYKDRFYVTLADAVHYANRDFHARQQMQKKFSLTISCDGAGTNTMLTPKE